jgi:hypothetical protein
MGKEKQYESYEIVIQGQVSQRLLSWFDGFQLAPLADGTTRISGKMLDRAAMHGLLNRIRDLGLILISVIRVETGQDHQLDK